MLTITIPIDAATRLDVAASAADPQVSLSIVRQGVARDAIRIVDPAMAQALYGALADAAMFAGWSLAAAPGDAAPGDVP